MTRIGLISDTHITAEQEAFWPPIAAALAGVDLILHAGDIYATCVLDWLEQIAPVVAAKGNGDVGRSAAKDRRVQAAHLLEVAGRRIGLVHIFLPEQYFPFDQYLARCFGGPVDVVVCGDTHYAEIVDHQGVLIVNPGSPTFPNNYQKQLGTVGLLEIRNGQCEAKIIRLAPG